MAARQHGVISRQQLVGLGISDTVIQGWEVAGHLRRIFRGVYAPSRHSIGAKGRIAGAILACGGRPLDPLISGVADRCADHPLASHRSASYLLGLTEVLPSVIDVISRRRAGVSIDGIRPHFVSWPAASERGHADGIPCTSPSRTLVDLAGVLSAPSLRRAVEMAATQRVLDLAAIDAVLARGRRRGAPALREILEEWRPIEDPARRSRLRSPFEARLLPILAAAGTPLPEVNAGVRVATRTIEVDLLWPDHRLVVEADSRRHHGIEAAFERDRRRDRDLLDAGYAVIRVTWRQAEREPHELAASIQLFLERRSGPIAALPGK